MLRFLIHATVLLCSFWSFTNCHAQIDHYWSQNFNTASAMLSGAVVGGESEVSSIFYNPAQISEQNESNFAISASLFRYQRYRLRNAVGRDIDLTRDVFGVLPKFVSYSNSKNKKIDYEFAIFTRNEQDFSMFEDESKILDILTQPEGEEFYNGDVQYKSKYNDKWISSGFSGHINENLRIGLGNYISVKSLRNEYEVNVRAFPQEDTVLIDGVASPYYVAATSNRALIKAWNVRILWKLGLQYDIGRWGIGLTMTSPSLLIYGEGSLKREISRTNIFNEADGQPAPEVAVTNFERKVDSNFKDPFSIALGVHYMTADQRNSLLFSAEYFAPLEEHFILEGEGNIQATPLVADTIDNSISSVKRKANEVLNIALGYRKYVNENLSLLGGFRTDFSSADKEFVKQKDLLLTRIPFDQFHITGGGAFVIKQKMELLVGLQLSWGGNENIKQLANFSDPVEFIPQTGQAIQGPLLPEMDVKYLAISVFFGFTYDLFTGPRLPSAN